jgi:xanthine dehydrogenase YagS FAD-binding subunit
MRPFAYARAGSVDEARELLGQRNARLVAGGTDLLTLMKEGLAEPDRLVDVTAIVALRGVRSSREGLRIGALATLRELERHPDAPAVLREALSDAATPQLRNVATVGGNLLQRNRCWYFRSEAHRCWLKGGKECLAVDGENRYHAIFGDGECRMVTPSDLAPALVALDASVLVRGDDGERRVPVGELFVAPTSRHRIEHSLRDREVILETSISNDALRRRGTYLKFMERAGWQFAVVSVAATAHVTDGRARDARIVAGAVASVPWRVRAVEELVEGERLDERVALAAAERFVKGARPMRDNGHKVQILRELLRRALLRLGSERREG